MRVVGLKAENFKILKAVDIKPDPDGHVVKIGGKNGQGKSSILDAIWVALAGRGVAPPKPIRKGEEKCTIRLDIGDIIVTRTFTEKGDDKPFTDTVKVESADGSTRVNKPQLFLDDLLGQIGFDPLAFVGMKAEAQAAMLLEMVPLPIDIEDYASKDASDYAIRRDLNRDAESLKARIDAIPAFEIPEDAPDRDKLLGQLTSATDHNMAIEQERLRRERERAAVNERVGDAESARARSVDLRQQAEAIIRQADQADADAEAIDKEIEEREEVLASLPNLDQPIDVNQARADLEAADATLRQIEGQRTRLALIEEHKAKVADAQARTDMMAAREEERRDALAKAKMPIEGLSFAINERGKPVVIYQGVPFEQTSSADQIRASTAIAMAANPELRVLRIKDGSLLDEDSMAIIEEMAQADDWQIWIEVVGSGNVGIVIENGEIKEAENPKEGQLI